MAMKITLIVTGGKSQSCVLRAGTLEDLDDKNRDQPGIRV